VLLSKCIASGFYCSEKKMSKETIYEEIKSYYKSNLELQDLRLEQDSKMLKEIGKVLNGNAFSEQLESKEPKDYTPFESDVVKLIERLMDMYLMMKYKRLIVRV